MKRMMKCQVEIFLIWIAIYSAPSTTDASITTPLTLATLIEFIYVGAHLRENFEFYCNCDMLSKNDEFYCNCEPSSATSAPSPRTDNTIPN